MFFSSTPCSPGVMSGTMWPLVWKWKAWKKKKHGHWRGAIHAATVLGVGLGATALQKKPTASGADRESQQTQFAGSVQTIWKRLTITGQVILTIAFFGQGCRETGLPQAPGLFFGQSHVLRPQQEIVEGLAQALQHGAPMRLTQPGIEVLLIKTATDPKMAATVAWEPGYLMPHYVFSMRGALS